MKATFYLVKDYINFDEMASLGLEPNQKSQVRAKYTGEYRPPKAGEWFLSGAIVEAYKANNDLTDSYKIAKLIRVKIIRAEVEITPKGWDGDIYEIPQSS